MEIEATISTAPEKSSEVSDSNTTKSPRTFHENLKYMAGILVAHSQGKLTTEKAIESLYGDGYLQKVLKNLDRIPDDIAKEIFALLQSAEHGNASAGQLLEKIYHDSDKSNKLHFLKILDTDKAPSPGSSLYRIILSAIEAKEIALFHKACEIVLQWKNDEVMLSLVMFNLFNDFSFIEKHLWLLPNLDSESVFKFICALLMSYSQEKRKIGYELAANSNDPEMVIPLSAALMREDVGTLFEIGFSRLMSENSTQAIHLLYDVAKQNKALSKMNLEKYLHYLPDDLFKRMLAEEDPPAPIMLNAITERILQGSEEFNSFLTEDKVRSFIALNPHDIDVLKNIAKIMCGRKTLTEQTLAIEMLDIIRKNERMSTKEVVLNLAAELQTSKTKYELLVEFLNGFPPRFFIQIISMIEGEFPEYHLETLEKVKTIYRNPELSSYILPVARWLAAKGESNQEPKTVID